jgi:hypothetical protein
VSCVSATLCMAVGEGADYSTSPPAASVIVAEWNGSSWTSASAPSSGTYSALEAVSCPTSSFCTAVGSSSASGVLAETWNGTSWTVGSVPSFSGAGVFALSCPTSASCFAVGSEATGTPGSSTPTTGSFIMEWNGSSWSQVAAPDGGATGSGTTNQLDGVSCGSTTQCIAVGLSSEQCGSTTPGGGSLTVSIAPTVVSASAASLYNPVSPTRICDTRPSSISGLSDQCTGKTLGPAGTLEVQVTGQANVPSGAVGVVLNVTVTGPTANGFLTIWPAGVTQPVASNLNFVAGETIPNLVQVQLGSSGAIDVYNSAGSTDVIVDVEGYFRPASGSTSGDSYTPISPVRIADTRCGASSPPPFCANEHIPSQNAGLTMFGPGTPQAVTVAGLDGIPASGVGAVVLNVTVTGTTSGSYLTVWPAGQPRPTASNLNWRAGETIPNRVVVPVGTSDQVDIANYAGSANVIVDIGGYYSTATTGDQYVATSPVRLLDTRQSSSALGAGQSLTLQVAGTDGVPASGVEGAVFNVTVTGGTAGSFLTVYPGSSEPAVSDLNWTAAETIPNLVVVALSSSGAVTISNAAGSVNVIVDLEGWYQSPSSAAAARPQSVSAASAAPSRLSIPDPGSYQAHYLAGPSPAPLPHC